MLKTGGVRACEADLYTSDPMSILSDQLMRARRAADMSQADLARKAGVNRKSIADIEAGRVDPKIDTLLSISRALGMEAMLVPAWLRQEVENFIRSGGKIIGQPPGVGAPLSIVDELLRTRR
jgi:DNA-binding XRE family transcriptional regulator